MSYNYQTEKPKILTPEGQKTLVKVISFIDSLTLMNESFTWKDVSRVIMGGSWTVSAYIDYLIELGYIKEHYFTRGNDVATQNRVYTKV